MQWKKDLKLKDRLKQTPKFNLKFGLAFRHPDCLLLPQQVARLFKHSFGQNIRFVIETLFCYVFEKTTFLYAIFRRIPFLIGFLGWTYPADFEFKII